MHLGLIGYGNIGAAVLEKAEVDRATVLVRPGRSAALAGTKAAVVEDSAAMIAARPDLVVECAGHEAVRNAVVPALRAGLDTVVVSVGALSDPELERELRDAAKAGGARMILPSGAIGGIDLLAGLSATGGVEVTYTGTKPPAAWRGTKAEETLQLDDLKEPAVFFEGSAREAARTYPKNANVAATLALAGAGFDATRVRLVADPQAGGNRHDYAVRSPLAEYEMRIDNRASAGNAKTSAATICSVLREIRNRIGPVVI